MYNSNVDISYVYLALGIGFQVGIVCILQSLYRLILIDLFCDSVSSPRYTSIYLPFYHKKKRLLDSHYFDSSIHSNITECFAMGQHVLGPGNIILSKVVPAL